MSNEQEQWFTVRDDPWGQTKLDEPPESLEEAIKVSGLDWSTISKPVYYADETADEDEDNEDLDLFFEKIPNTFANVRSDNGFALGVVTKRYAQFSNAQAFSFLSDLYGSEMDFVSGGFWNGGKRVWVMMKIPAWIEVGGDPIGQYAFIHTSHDGKHAVTGGITPVRWNCKNVVNADLRKTKKNKAARVYTLRHVGDMEQKMEDARGLMDIATNYYTQFKVLGDTLATKKVPKNATTTYVEALLPTPEDQGDLAIRRNEERRAAIEQIFRGKGELGNTEGNAPGSWWALYNAAVEWADHYRPERGKGNGFKRSIDDPDGFKSLAFDLALGANNL